MSSRHRQREVAQREETQKTVFFQGMGFLEGKEGTGHKPDWIPGPQPKRASSVTTNVERLFGNTLQTTEEWLASLMRQLATEDIGQAYRVMRSTLHLLRDRLVPSEAVHLGAQLPMLLRGLYFEGWVPSQTPKRGTFGAFLLEVQERALDSDPQVDPEPPVRAVCRWLEEHVSQGEIDDVRNFFPGEFRSLWSEPIDGPTRRPS